MEAAKTVLEQNGNVPLSPAGMWAIIDKLKLVESRGKTPIATLDTTLRIYMKDSRLNPETLKIRNPKGITIFEEVAKKFRLVTLNNQTPALAQTSQNQTSCPITVSQNNNAKILYQITCEDLSWDTVSVISQNNVIRYEKAKCDEYTYIIMDAAHRTKKIGKTRNIPFLRQQQLKTGNPLITIDHVFPSSLYSEDYLHNKFDEYRQDQDHEWFFMAKCLEQFLSSEKDKHHKVYLAYGASIVVSKLEKEMLSLL